MSRLTVKSIEEKAETMDPHEAFKWISTISGEYGKTVKKLADKYYKRAKKIEQEKERLLAMTKYELAAYEKGYILVGGIDEAGRGPLAGPVVASCVILPKGIIIEKLNDSKKLSESVRSELYDIIKAKSISYGIGIVEQHIIDEINIYEATKRAMELAVGCMKKKPDFLVIDAVNLDNGIPQLSVTKADLNSISVAAASILAKVTRDRIMVNMDGVYPEYGFAQHKGYGTKAHIQAIKEYGLCQIHRRSFTKNIV